MIKISSSFAAIENDSFSVRKFLFSALPAPLVHLEVQLPLPERRNNYIQNVSRFAFHFRCFTEESFALKYVT